MSNFIESSDIILFVIVLVWTWILLLKSVQPSWLRYVLIVSVIFFSIFGFFTFFADQSHPVGH